MTDAFLHIGYWRSTGERLLTAAAGETADAAVAGLETLVSMDWVLQWPSPSCGDRLQVTFLSWWSLMLLETLATLGMLMAAGTLAALRYKVVSWLLCSLSCSKGGWPWVHWLTWVC